MKAKAVTGARNTSRAESAAGRKTAMVGLDLMRKVEAAENEIGQIGARGKIPEYQYVLFMNFDFALCC